LAHLVVVIITVLVVAAATVTVQLEYKFWVLVLQRAIPSTSCMHGHYSFPWGTIHHCLHIWWQIGDLFCQGWHLADLRYQRKRIREQLWRNRWEKQCTRSIH